MAWNTNPKGCDKEFPVHPDGAIVIQPHGAATMKSTPANACVSPKAPIRVSGTLPTRPPRGAFNTCKVSGIWFGSAAAQPGQRLAGLHGDLLVTSGGDFSYELGSASTAQLRRAKDTCHIEETYSLNIGDSAGSSCVAQLSIVIEAAEGHIALDARFQVLSTVTERYCLTRQHGLALLCMETGDHFIMSQIDTPLSAVARSHQREFFGIGGQHLLRIDPINGNTIWIGILDLPRQIRCLESAPDGWLYGVDSLGDLYRVQPSNGACTLLVRLSKPSTTRGAIAYHQGCVFWTAADNRLHRFHLESHQHDIALEALQPMAPETVHERAIAMMPALDGAMFVATADGILRLNLSTGGWTDTRVRAKLAALVTQVSPAHPSWGGREPDPMQACEPQASFGRIDTTATSH